MPQFEIAVHYPAPPGAIRLRTSLDWERDVAPVPAGAAETEPPAPPDTPPAATTHLFHLAADEPFLYYKPVRRDAPDAAPAWAIGENRLALPDRPAAAWPAFAPDAACSFCTLRTLDPGGGRPAHRYRVYYPPGYHENPLARYPVLYMHDGQNLFLSEEAFAGATWETSRTLETLTAMNAVEPALVVGIHPDDRQRDYTRAGWDDYADFLVRHLKPAIDAEFRTRPGPRHTAVMGSSLGGVVSFHLGWRHPEVFGQAACLSSTFGWADDLLERVGREARPATRFYLDSGWPRDNYEVTRLMRDRLRLAGYRDGADLLYLTFPGASHDERSWALRCHIPFQFLLGGAASECPPSRAPRPRPRPPARRAPAPAPSPA